MVVFVYLIEVQAWDVQFLGHKNDAVNLKWLQFGEFELTFNYNLIKEFVIAYVAVLI
jgi:hypothetical protein